MKTVITNNEHFEELEKEKTYWRKTKQRGKLTN